MVPLFGYYFHGGYYPAGGSGRLADALVEAIEARGGEVRLKTRVARILVEEGRAAGVELADGTRVAASAVVANADLKRTFLELVERAICRGIFARASPRPSRRPPRSWCTSGSITSRIAGRQLHVVGDDRVGVEVLSQRRSQRRAAGPFDRRNHQAGHERRGARMVPSRGRRGLEGLALRANTKSASARSAIA